MMQNIINVLLFLLVFSCKPSGPTAPMVDTVESSTIVVEKIDTTQLNYVMGRFEPQSHPDFAKIDPKYSSKENLYLRKEAYESFQKMHEAANAEDISLIIHSATRNFEYQKGIWEKKWSGQTTLHGGIKATEISNEKERALKILLYSSMPGSSRHHWGTDIDLNNFTNAYFESGEGLRIYNWLTEHGGAYGFCQPYTNKSTGRSGYEEEKWHWSYMPLSKDLTEFARNHLKDEFITGFQGAKTAAEIGIIRNYVLGINNQCL
jgi:zinc D-Ala-D-Ala carboxypeptidase